MNILVIDAHPDDAELGLGGTIFKMVKSGYNVYILDLTDGEPTPFGTKEKRIEEAKKAAEILGVKKRITLDLPNRYLFDTKEARIKVAEIIREYEIDFIFTHHGEDVHPDHIAARKITDGARFYSKLTKTDMKGNPRYPKKIFYYIASHKRKVFEPDFIIDITEEFEKKIEAIKCYESQFLLNPERRNVFDLVESVNKYYGSRIGARYGEGIIIEESFGIRDISFLFK
ncbi:MAG: bacillithiol biosynthesis deacetylase BshB1 [candidate division WOR-3 bacterium]